MMKRPPKRTIKIPNAERLKNIALYYLSRYAASEASLRRVLHNRMRRATMAHPDFAADHQKQSELKIVIEQIIEAHKKTGAVNDTAIAEMKVAGLRRAGKSERFIKLKLAERGLGKDLVSQALEAHDADVGEDAELKAALAFCKRRRLGNYRPEIRRKDGDAKKDFATLARAGYSSNLIRKVLVVPIDDIPFLDG